MFRFLEVNCDLSNGAGLFFWVHMTASMLWRGPTYGIFDECFWMSFPFTI